MKIRRDSITWGEPGKIKALAHMGMSPGPKIRILLAALVGSLLALAFLTYARFNNPILNAIVVLCCVLGPAMVAWVSLYAGRGIELTRDQIAMFSLGSRIPRSIKFSDVVRCETQIISAENCEIPVLVVETSDGKTETIELPQGSDTEVVATFLRKRGLACGPAAQHL